jgi:Lar family restriction alleviation protein
MLKPCPFCGHKSPELESDERNSEGDLWWYVACPECGTSGPYRITSKEATESWNTRPDGVVEAARKALDAHHREAYLTCPETCWCWDLETALTKYEAAVGGE